MCGRAFERHEWRARRTSGIASTQMRNGVEQTHRGNWFRTILTNWSTHLHECRAYGIFSPWLIKTWQITLDVFLLRGSLLSAYELSSQNHTRLLLAIIEPHEFDEYKIHFNFDACFGVTSSFQLDWVVDHSVTCISFANAPQKRRLSKQTQNDHGWKDFLGSTFSPNAKTNSINSWWTVNVPNSQLNDP